MKAITRNNDAVTVVDRPQPSLGALQLRVQVFAAALNNADLSSNSDEIAGFEFSGVVEAVGDDVPTGMTGRRVMGIAESAFAEYVVADHRHVIEVPDGLAFAQASALPTALTTEYGALRRAGLRSGDSVLITAATSGIALVGIQVAHELGAGVVIGTTRNPARADFLHGAGADHVIVLRDDDVLANRVRELTGAEGADVVLDHISGAGLNDAISSARKGGAVVSVGRITGASAEIDLFMLARQQIALRSVSYGLTPVETIGDLFAGVRTDVLSRVAAGRVRAIVDSEFDFDDAAAAYERLGSGDARGKVVLTRSTTSSSEGASHE